MNEKELKEKKREILRKLALDENEILKNLEKIVNLAEPFIRFDVTSGDIEFIGKLDLTYEEKIFLYALVRYFTFHFEISEDYNFKRHEMRNALLVPEKTGLSNQIGNLSKKKAIKKLEKDNYKINPFKIEDILAEIREKYEIED